MNNVENIQSCDFNNAYDHEFIEKINKEIKDILPKKRYSHSVGVSITAACLGMRYEKDIFVCQVAGLLHDCARYLSGIDLIKACDRDGISLRDIERANPDLAHAKYGAYLAEKEYKINDSEIINSILYHTTGRPNMSLLEKIIFIADYIEPGRYKQSNLEIIRKEAFIDIDMAIKHILTDTVNYLNGQIKPIDDMTQITYNYYCKER